MDSIELSTEEKHDIVNKKYAYGFVKTSISYIDEDHPRELCCPITLTLMKEPVILMGDGHTYEKKALINWLRSNNTSPLTNNTLQSKQFVINYAIKTQIDAYNRKLIYLSRQKYQTFFISSRGKLRPLSTSITVNIQLFGDSNVGKTTLRKFVEFNEHRYTDTTIGPEFSFIQKMDKYRNKIINVRIGDINGQFDRFHSLMKQCYRNINGAILVCSVDIKKSVKHMIYQWHNSLCEYAPDDVYVIVIINKCDLLHSNSGNDIQNIRKYQRIQKAAVKFANQNGYPIYNTCCLTGQYIHTAFNDLTDRIIRDTQIWKRLIKNKYKSKNVKTLPEKSNANCC